MIYPAKIFEYHIRCIGGLLGGYFVSGERLLLAAAKRAADAMINTGVFNTASGFPRPNARIVHPSSPVRWVFARVLDRIRNIYDAEQRCNSLAGVGSFSLEFYALSRETGEQYYANIADAIMDRIEGIRRRDPRKPIPTKFSVIDDDPVGFSCGFAARSFRVGSGADSFYEYLVKSPILLGRDRNSMYSWLLENVKSELLQSTPRGLFLRKEKYSDHIAHLDCYFAGTVALASKYLKGRRGDLGIAEGIAEACAHSYMDSPSGIGAETSSFDPVQGYTKPVADFYSLSVFSFLLLIVLFWLFSRKISSTVAPRSSRAFTSFTKQLGTLNI